jgi:HD superfamily phosphohydrolase
MDLAINALRLKGNNINDEEAVAVKIAILLHDIGHGPFSHALEHSIVNEIFHEELSLIFMKCLNKEYRGGLGLAIDIFLNKYPKHFLHQLVSSQLDMDRLDYLRRDSFYTGVIEGAVGSDRIIKMLDVVNDQLVVEAKGIYSIEKFLIARRLMYWQVYLHKTVISAEQLLVNILKRAKELAGRNVELPGTEPLKYFLYNKIFKKDLVCNEDEMINVMEYFAKLDDYDIITSIKTWSDNSDRTLSILCQYLLNRKLYKVKIQNNPFDIDEINAYHKKTQEFLDLKPDEVKYFTGTDSISNFAYDLQDCKINVLFKNGELIDISSASDMLNTEVLSKTITKYFMYYPKALTF